MESRRVVITLLADCPESIPLVARWLHDEWFQALGWSLTAAEREIGGRANRDRLPLTLVALSGRQPVGTVSLIEDPAVAGPEGMVALAGLYVLPCWRGHGIGRRLCCRAVQTARSLGVTTVYLLTRDRESFFSQIRWQKVSETVIEFAEVLEEVTFMKYCEPPPYQRPFSSTAQTAGHSPAP